MRNRDELAQVIERSIGTAMPSLFFSDDELRIIVQALRGIAQPEGALWISFKDRLPPKGTHVLATYEDGAAEVYPAHLAIEYAEYYDEPLMYWMPLPELPKRSPQPLTPPKEG